MFYELYATPHFVFNTLYCSMLGVFMNKNLPR